MLRHTQSPWIDTCLDNCVSQFFITVTKYLSKTAWERKDLFWLIVSEVSVHSQLVPLFWAWGAKEEHHGGRAAWRKLAHLVAAREQREKETRRIQEKIHLSKACPQWPTSSSQAPAPSFHHLPIMPSNYESINGQNLLDLITSQKPNLWILHWGSSL
jgi:hypothetical protein